MPRPKPFFTDENISSRAVRLLDIAFPACTFDLHRDHFDQGTADTVWMPKVAAMQPKPTILCGDGRILSNDAELATLKSCELMCVFLAAQWMTSTPWPDFAWKLIKAWTGVVEQVEKARAPTVFKLGAGRALKCEKVSLVSQL